MSDIYYCYSKRLKDFLSAMKVRYIASSINKKTNMKYWTFNKSERLDELIQLWNQIKNK